jgi:hypothetical protein
MGGIQQESPIVEHINNNTLPDSIFDSGVLLFPYYFLILKKAGY